MIQKTLTLGSLFDGSGGFPLGWILAGIVQMSSTFLHGGCGQKLGPDIQVYP